jgi:uncharacterized ion transporter superfamily protein YfcC
MENQGMGIRMGKKAFLTSFFVLSGLILALGILTLVVPSGAYERISGTDGLQILADTFRIVEKPNYPIWRWILAPIEVLASPDGLNAIVIIVFIMIVGGSFSILDKAQVLKEAVSGIARRFGTRRYLLLGVVSFFFMGIGSVLGIFEETIPLVPVAIALSLSLGWDIYIGLGMSILATGFGFSAAIANPFSIGVAQRLAGVPLFSGIGFRIFIFLCIFIVFFAWLLIMAKRSEKGNSPWLGIDSGAGISKGSNDNPRRGAAFFGISIAFLIVSIITISITKSLVDYSMPIIALVFLIAGFGSGLVAKMPPGDCVAAFGKGVVGIIPGIVLILMAMAVKYIIVSGGIMDTILHFAASLIDGSSGYAAASLIYILTLGLNFFIGSATAKAFLLIPLIAPLADLSGLSRQIAIQAFAFGDGFSNMFYPTNAVLLIALGVAGVSWTSWAKKTWILQCLALLVTMALLMLGISIGYS